MLLNTLSMTANWLMHYWIGYLNNLHTNVSIRRRLRHAWARISNSHQWNNAYSKVYNFAISSLIPAERGCKWQSNLSGTF